jgi:hypothetical protein
MILEALECELEEAMNVLVKQALAVSGRGRVRVSVIQGHVHHQVFPSPQTAGEELAFTDVCFALLVD